MVAVAPTRRIAVDAGGATALLAGTAVCFGLVPLFARELQAAGTDSPTIALYRCAISALLLLPWLPRAREKRREALLVLGAGLGMGLGWIGYFEALETVPVATVGVVYMSYPLFTLLFAWVLVGHRPGPRSWAAVALILLAAVLAFSPGPAGAVDASALLLAVPTPITFAFIIVVVSACVHRLSAPERMACAMLGSVLGLAPLSAGAFDGDWFGSLLDTWPLIAGMTLVTAFAPQLLYSYAAPLVGPARSAAAGSFELPTMFLVGWLAFGERVGGAELLAAGLIVTAMALSPPVRRERPRTAGENRRRPMFR